MRMGRSAGCLILMGEIKDSVIENLQEKKKEVANVPRKRGQSKEKGER